MDQPRLIFNSTLCNACGKCEEACPQQTCKLTGNDLMGVEGFCVMCQKCVDICPADAIGIPGIIEPKECEIDIEGKGAVYIADCKAVEHVLMNVLYKLFLLIVLVKKITINEDVCIKCGVCSQTCPWNELYISEKVPVKRTKEIKAFDLETSKLLVVTLVLKHVLEISLKLKVTL